MPAKPLQKRAQQQEAAAAAVKRVLLASRQTCNAGYGYCYGQYSPSTRVQLPLTYAQSREDAALILMETENVAMMAPALPHRKPAV